ncbi:MAG: barstar family protein [Oscillospiraceae bacterium]|nr:barstar family protein [Oscillospiraceae bacterium]
MQITIDCSEINDRTAFHRVFSSKLRLPGFYGNNLDALYDCLTSLSEKTTITLLHMQSLIDNLGSYGRAAINMIARAERENTGRLTVNMR